MNESIHPSCELLFVYGTLRRGYPHPQAERLAAEAEWRGRGRAPGRLFDLGPYPAAVKCVESDVADAADAAGVIGDVYRLRDPAGTLAWLDAYEDCPRPEDAALTSGLNGGLYTREIVEVLEGERDEVRAGALDPACGPGDQGQPSQPSQPGGPGDPGDPGDPRAPVAWRAWMYLYAQPLDGANLIPGGDYLAHRGIR